MTTRHGSDGPGVVESIAVRREDLIAAYEHNRQGGDRRAVVRLTPPFHARMRARIHVESGSTDDLDSPSPIPVRPSRLIDTGSVPAPPTPDETEDELRRDPDEEYTIESHRERHATAMDEWRTAVERAVRDRTTIDTPEGPHEVEVKLLGSKQ